MTVHDSLITTIGGTPLVRLGKLFDGAGFDVYAKLEMLNPGGSLKDRSAREMLLAAVREGKVGPGSTVVESSSGNLAIGLAQLCNLIGCRFICVIDPRTTMANRRILQAYGARLDLVEKPDPATGEYVPARLARVRRWLRKLPGAYWPNQYANENNAYAHQHTTMAEIVSDLPRVDYLLCGVSTCGTLRGCIDYVRLNGMQTKVVAVDALGSLIFDKNSRDDTVERLLPGLGAGRRPELCPPEGEGIHAVVYVSDRDCVEACRSLVREEGILAGGSSGGIIAAVEQFRERIEPGAVCVVVLPDRGERYLDTVYSDEWVLEKFGLSFSATIRAGRRKRDGLRLKEE
ncbi:2,3-diaminopropionate biosynthesis protein SbnA [Paenibacillus sp. NPDC058071]|uniref:2,3-diaminopropionate biosynthesis protein SbnA n=1 Tax=Paenibacillus sp. NPDC058071 TaxID=3346326 RepID=UPI0036D97688